MGEAKRRRKTDYAWEGRKGDGFAQIVAHVLEGSNDNQVVIGPLVKPPLGKTGNDYFVIASSETGRGFRCDALEIGEGVGDGEECRAGVVTAFTMHGIGRGFVVYDTGDELFMVRLCETLWPGERITRIRKGIEAERGEHV